MPVAVGGRRTPSASAGLHHRFGARSTVPASNRQLPSATLLGRAMAHPVRA